MSRIFISYKRVDKDKVFKIKEQIDSALGEKCWIDLDGIESDAQFKNVIIKAINKAEIVLFMYSQSHSKIIDFEKDWTVRELNFAQAKNKRIVFVNIDGSKLTDAFTFDFGTKQQVDGRSQAAIAKLCKDIKTWLGINDIPETVQEPLNQSQSQSQSQSLSQGQSQGQGQSQSREQNTGHSLTGKLKRIKNIAVKGCLGAGVLFILLLIIGSINECNDEKQVKSIKANPYVYLDSRNEPPKDSIKITWPESVEYGYQVDFVRNIFGDMRKVTGAGGKSFYISSKPVNEGLWDYIMEDGYPGIEERPAKTGVSWNECNIFCERLNMKLGTSFSLPTKEEWKQATIKNEAVINYNPLTDKQEYCKDWATDANGNQLPEKIICGFDVVKGEATSNLQFQESSIAPTERPDTITFRLVLRGK